MPRRLRAECLEDRLAPAILTVNSVGDDVPASTSITTLREAITKANADAVADTIVFASSLNGKTITLTGELPTIVNPLTIEGPAANLLTIDCNDTGRALQIAGGVTASVSGLTITNGDAGGDGGAIFVAGTLVVSGCALTNNRSDFNGGAIGMGSGANLTVANSTLSGNAAADSGGGIANLSGGTLEVTNTTVSGNTADQFGGGIFNQGPLTATNSTVVLNRADADGDSDGIGGGIDNNSTATLVNTIVAGNRTGTGSTPNDLDGLFEAGTKGNVVGDTATAGGLTNGVDNLVGDGVGGTLNLATVIDLNLAFNGGSTLTHALALRSPAVDRGTGDNGGLTADQRGSLFARAAKGTPDAGAVESQLLPPTLHVGTLAALDDGDYGPGKLSLREALSLNNTPGLGVNAIDFPGPYSGKVITLNGTQLPAITDDVTIAGPGANSLTIDGNDLSEILQVGLGASVAVSGLTITNGNSTTDGSAFYNQGTLVVAGCTISDNTSAGFGGAVINFGTMTVSGCTLSGNKAGDTGGAITNSPGGKLTVVNSTLSGNSSNTFGGAIDNNSSNSVLVVRDSTIVLNRADADGTGGNGGGLDIAGSVTLFNSIVAGNLVGTGATPNDITGVNVNGASVGNVIGTATTAGGLFNNADNTVGVSGGGTRPLNTIVSATLADNGGPTRTHTPVAGSVALDRGINAKALDAAGVALATDQRGLPRSASLRVDAGAVEVPNTAPSLVTPLPDRTALEDAANVVINLATHFTDFHNGGTGLTYTVVSNSNTKVLAATVGGTNLTRDFVANANGPVTITVRATDTSNATLTDTFVVNVGAVNDAPVLNTAGSPTLPNVAEDSTAHQGLSVGSFAGSSISDVDAGALKGIAVTALTNTANGTWQYSIDAGNTWRNFGSVTSAAARLLRDVDRVRFVPNANFNGTATFSYRAWDRTTGTTGNTANITATGGATAFSSATESASVTVTPVNDAPVLNTAGSPRLPNVPRNSTNPAGVTVATLVGASITDADAGALEGIAVVGLTGTSGGRWQYRLTPTGTWTTFTASAATARLLPSTASLRFLPNANFTGSATLSYRAWDRTTGTSGGTANVTATGGATAFSTGVEIAAVTVV